LCLHLIFPDPVTFIDFTPSVSGFFKYVIIAIFTKIDMKFSKICNNVSDSTHLYRVLPVTQGTFNFTGRYMYTYIYCMQIDNDLKSTL